jgi:putative endonuclease
MERSGCAYILTNKNKTTLYIGVTSDLQARLEEHKNGEYKNSFSNRYNLYYLVYFEYFSRIDEAIAREKELKGWVRKKKEDLINKVNPSWEDWSNRDDL